MGSCKQGDGLGFPQKNWEQPTKWSWIVLHVGETVGVLLLYTYIYMYICMQPTKKRLYENELFRPNFMVTSMGKAENYEIWG
jgi:hypothetical protein